MEIGFMSAADVARQTAGFAGVYRAAFAGAPYHRQEHEVSDFVRVLPMHTLRDGFRCVAAFERRPDAMIGFAYGYRSQAGQWWYDNVARALGPLVAADWLTDAFQVTEVAVIPSCQGQGIGSTLHDMLLSALPHARGVLSTLDAPTVAYQMYLNRGWLEILSGFRFPGVARPYRIMGRILSQM
jgi:GNAT superfamily N-acetyltransferase